MKSPATRRRAVPDPEIVFVVDPNAEPDDPLPALVQMLIGIRDKRRARAAAQLEAEQEAGTEATP